MKRLKLFFPLLLLSFSLFAQDIKIYGNTVEPQQGDTVYVFNNGSAIRSGPSALFNTIGNVNLGELIVVDSGSGDYYVDINNRAEYCKIKHKKGSGYIHVSNIAIQKLNFEKGDAFFLINQKVENDSLAYLHIKAVVNGKERPVFQKKLFGELYTFKIEDNKGLDSIQNIITIDYMAEACLMEAGEDYLTWDGNALKELVYVSSWVNAGVSYYSESVTFPSDSLGKKGKIIFHIENSEVIDLSIDLYKTEKVEREHYWYNKSAHPAFVSETQKE